MDKYWVYQTKFRELAGPFNNQKTAKIYIKNSINNTLKVDSLILLQTLEITKGSVDKYIDDGDDIE